MNNRFSVAAHLLPRLALAAVCAIGQGFAAPTEKQERIVLTTNWPAPDGVRTERDVTFLEPERAEKLDLYIPADRQFGVLSPAVVIIHGGGWTGGNKAQVREFRIGTTLAKAGYVCASVEYKKEGVDRWPTNLKDSKNAVRFLRANSAKYQVDADNIGVLGGSAGGHLALMVAYTSGVKELSPEAPYPGVRDDVKAVVDLYGVTDLTTRQATEPDGTPNGKLREAGLFPEKRGENEAKWKLASPVNHISKSSPATLILHGTADTTVDREQSMQLAKALGAAGVEHELKLLPGVGHTFDLEEWQKKPLPQDLRPLVIGFLDRHLKTRPTSVSRPGAPGLTSPNCAILPQPTRN
jgi:acetyl esterase/lipase